MSETPETDRIVWIDCEMTGLDFKNDLLVEIACVITNAQLEVIAEGLNIVIQAPAERLESMDPFVVNMHTESGLLPEIPNGISLEAAEEQLFEYISSHIPEASKAPLAGSLTFPALKNWYVAGIHGPTLLAQQRQETTEHLATSWTQLMN
jgi:oligoribonuclease (3'-5' exoribonuclease)